jgi:hypothetical protein
MSSHRSADEVPALAARYYGSDVDVFADERGHRMGKDGIFVRTLKPPRLGVLLAFEIYVDGEDPPLEGVVRVVAARAVEDAAPGHPAGMAIKFIHFEDVEHAADVLGRMRLRATPSMLPPPPPGSDPDDEPAEAFFFAKSAVITWTAPLTIEEELGIVDVRAVRERDPAFKLRQARLRWGVAAAITAACLLGSCAALRGALAPEPASASHAAPSR